MEGLDSGRSLSQVACCKKPGEGIFLAWFFFCVCFFFFLQSRFQSPPVRWLREATLEALTGMKVPSALGEHAAAPRFPEPRWNLSIKRLMLSFEPACLKDYCKRLKENGFFLLHRLCSGIFSGRDHTVHLGDAT